MTGDYRLNLEDLAARGDATAVEGQSARVTYGELAARAKAVAVSLRTLGVAPGDPVGLLSSGRGHDEIVGLAAILALHAAVVPLDATAPPKRLADILRARGVRAIVADGAAWNFVETIDDFYAKTALQKLARLTLDPEGKVVSAIGSDVEAGDRTIPAARTLACILHTSGSTGTPKPVPITWAGLDAFTAWTIELVGLAPGDRVLRIAELIFDLAWFDHLATLRAGATLVTMSRRDLAVGRALRDAIGALRPTVMYGVPSLFTKLTGVLAGTTLADVPRAIFYAGEVFPPRDLRELARVAPGAAIYNFFGPTETNVCTFHAIRPADLDGVSETPIGIATPFAACSLVDEDKSVVLGEGTGELIVSGPTALGGGPFATHDRVERKADGLFYFRGRIDRMVKIRGYRVEPGEVEAALDAHPSVQRAAVVPFEDQKLGKVLRAYVCLRASAEAVDERSLRMSLAERLPPYMVPDKVVLLPELPLTPTGKIDYRALG